MLNVDFAEVLLEQTAVWHLRQFLQNELGLLLGCFQFQVKEGATGDFIFLKEVTLNIKGKMVEPGKSVVAGRFLDATKPLGEWNTIVVTSKDCRIKQELNGKLVNEGIEASVSEGRILLQYEGFPIDFRKVQIVEL